MVFEIPLYRYRPEVSFEEAKRMSDKLNEFLKTASGFKVRRTYYDRQSNTWIDVAEWETMELALQGVKDFERSPIFQEFIALADPSFNHMHHAELVDTFEV